MNAIEWQELSLEHIADIHDNLREPVNSSERAKRVGPYPYYGATGQVGWIDGYRQDGEYVLLGEDGAPFLDPTKNKAYLVSGKCWVNNHAHVLRGKDGVCINKFLLYALNATDYRGYANGTTRLKLTQSAMRTLPIRTPGVKQQVAVVEKLDELFSDLDAGVASLVQAQAKLKRYRASVLKAAVEGRLTAQWRAEHPDTEPATELLERILTERRKKWEAAQLKKYADAGKAPPKGWQGDGLTTAIVPETADLPTLPDGWSWTYLGKLLDGIEAGKSFKCEERPPLEGEIGVAKVSAVSWGEYDELESKTCTSPDLVDRDLFIEPDDFLFSRANTIELVGACVIVKIVTKDVMLSDKTLRFRFPEKLSLWVLFWLRSQFGRREIERLATGNQESMRNIGQGRIREIRVALPPKQEQVEATARMEAALSSITHAETEIAHALTRAARLRQAILKRAFEGRLV